MTLDNMYKEFFGALSKPGINAVTEVAYQYFKRPVIVIDHVYKLVCQLPSEQVSDIVFDSVQSNREIPLAVVKILEKGKYRKYLEENPEPSFVNWGTLSVPRIMGTVEVGKKAAGFYSILFFEDTPTDEEMAVAELFSSALAIAFERNRTYGAGKETLGRYLLSQLFTENAGLNETISLCTEYYPGILTGNYTIIYGIKRNDTVSLQYIAKILEEQHTECFSLPCDENNIYLLIYKLKDTGNTANKNVYISKIIGFLNSYDIICGVSDLFAELTQISSGRYMAEEALKIGRSFEPDKRVFYFSDHMFRGIISRILSAPHSEIFMAPQLNRLIDYDKTYHTDYYSTLKTYLINFRDLSCAAQALGIHRNSLKYRLAKIREISSIDFIDTAMCIQLLVNTYMLEQPLSEQKPDYPV